MEMKVDAKEKTEMDAESELQSELASLERMTVTKLRIQYTEVFGSHR